MTISFQISKVLNIIALICVLGGPYGLPFTGLLQVIAGMFYLYSFPKNKWIYTYFVITIMFLTLLKMGLFTVFSWLFIIPPLLLIIFLSYIIHSKKLNHEL